MTNVTDWLDAAKARADAATDGPWEAVNGSGDESVWGPELIVIGNYTANDGYDSAAWEDGTPADRKFIAAARTDLPKALDALRAVLDMADDADEDARAIEDDEMTVGYIPANHLRNIIATALGVTS